MSRILIVDDEANLRRLLASLLREGGHEVVQSHSVDDARVALRKEIFDLVITDQRMPGGSGTDLVASCRETDPTLPVVMLTAFATLELAVEAMRQGAFDVLGKPFVPDQVLAVVQRATERTQLLRDNEELRREVGSLRGGVQLIGSSEAVRDLRERIDLVGPTNASILISGETGTGKELVARAVHATSSRRDRPFVAINCAAFTETLLESELFGHERGAFTGAERARKGVFESANRGTLFLDEAGEMSLSLQARLLRILADGELVRVGSSVARHVDVRIIAASNRDLHALVREGRFREDLYYRLAVVPIDVPPLRSRLEDLPALVEHFLSVVPLDRGARQRSLAPSAMARLKGYSFPGNVRELRNLIERATILTKGDTITAEDLPGLTETLERSEGDVVDQFVDALPAELDLRETLRTVEERIVARALDGAEGVQAEAARRLGISRSDMNYRLHRRGSK